MEQQRDAAIPGCCKAGSEKAQGKVVVIELRVRLPIAFFSAVMAIALAHPAPAGELAKGLELARRWCASCHQVEPSGAERDMARSFAAISNDPATTPRRLRAWLFSPHPPMPNLSLAASQEDDIIAYLMSLKTE
jgi:mono/diheme cytochrome c family protein